MQKVIWLWLRGEASIENGIVKCYSHIPYNPYEYPNLPNALVKVKDETSAVRFANQYGLLGYDNLVETIVGPKKKQGGDPLWWVLEHAKAIILVLELLDALSAHDTKKLGEILERAKIKVSKGVSSELETQFEYINLIEKETFPLTTSTDSVEGRLEYHTRLLISNLVNLNTRNIRQELLPSYRGKESCFVYSLKTTALIEAIWRMVGEAAIKWQEEKNGTIYFCETCGTPFIRTHKKQRFCPPNEWEKESICGTRYRMRKYRKGGSK